METQYLFNVEAISDFFSSPDVIHPSSIWGAIQGTKKNLGKGCSWKIGNGIKVKFWKDVWLKDYRLIGDFLHKDLVDLCKQRYGNLVSHYWQNDSQVNLIDIDKTFNYIQLSLNVVSLYPHLEDEIIWQADPSGQFKVSSIFVSKDKDYKPLWSHAWIKGLFPKINIFFWILLQNKILTLDNLQKRGINVVNRCTL